MQEYNNSNVYKYTAEMKLLAEESTYYVDNINIRSIVIDSDYKNMNMPMVFLTLSIDRRLIDIMIKNQNVASVVFNIKRCVTNSDMPDLFTDYINDEFIYFVANDINKNDEYDYGGNNEDREDLFKIISIGLLSLKHINKNKRLINGIFSGSLSSMMHYITEDLDILIEPPVNNDMLENLVIPPMNSVAKYLEYLNSVKVFYDTQYRFFIGFDCAYLISSSGDGIEEEKESINNVIITIKNSYDESSKIQGMITNETQSVYEIQADAQDCELSDNYLNEKSYSKLSYTNTSGNNSNVKLKSITENSIINEKIRSLRISNENDGIINNIVSSMDNSSIQLLIQKNDIDSEVLTINKEYTIKADETYNTDRYNGKYILVRKRELYIREDETFTMCVMLLFEKVIK